MSSRKSRRVPIPATQVQRNFGDVVRRVYSGQEHVVVEKDGLPVVAIISMAEYQELMNSRELQEQDKQQRLQKFRDAARVIGETIEQSDVTEEDALEHLEETKHEVYQKTYGTNHTQ